MHLYKLQEMTQFLQIFQKCTNTIIFHTKQCISIRSQNILPYSKMAPHINQKLQFFVAVQFYNTTRILLENIKLKINE